MKINKNINIWWVLSQIIIGIVTSVITSKIGGLMGIILGQTINILAITYIGCIIDKYNQY